MDKDSTMLHELNETLYKRHMECNICYNDFDEDSHCPIVNECGHTVCKSCYSKIAEICPICKKNLSMQSNKNFALLEIMSSQSNKNNNFQKIHTGIKCLNNHFLECLSGRKCDYCCSIQVGFGCLECKIHKCYKCLPTFTLSNKTCFMNHLLIFNKTKFICLKCSTTSLFGLVCPKCEYYSLCPKCSHSISFPINGCPTNHKLVWDYGETECARCLKKNKGESCLSCNYKICISCKDPLYTNTLNNSLNPLEIEEIMTGSDDKTIKIWNLSSGGCTKTISGHSYAIRNILKMDYGEIVSVSLRNINVFNLNIGVWTKEIYDKYAYYRTMIYIQGREVATDGPNFTIKFWDLSTGITTRIFLGHIEFVSTLLKLNDYQIVSGSEDSFIKIWDISTGLCIKTLSGHTGKVNCLIKFNDNLIISCCGNFENKKNLEPDFTIKMWDLFKEKCIKTLRGHTNSIFSIIKLNDSEIVSGGEDNTIKFWNISNGNCIKSFMGHSGRINSLIKLNNNRIGSCSDDKTIKIWNITTGKCIDTFTGHTGSVTTMIKFN